MALTKGKTDSAGKRVPFAEVVTARKTELGLSYRTLSARTKELDPEGRGLSTAYLVQLFKGNEDPIPRAIRLIAAALDLEPDDFLEYRLHLARAWLDERIDFERAAETYDALPAAARDRMSTEIAQPPRRGRRLMSV